MLSDPHPSVKDWPKTWKRACIVRAAGGWRRVGPARAGVYKKSAHPKPRTPTHPHAQKDQACSSLDIDRQRWGQDYPYEKRGQARSARLPSLDGLLRIILPPSFRGSIETTRRKVTPGGRLSATRREEETDARLAGAMRSKERPFPGLVPRASSWRPKLGTLPASERTMRRSRASSADVTALLPQPAGFEAILLVAEASELQDLAVANLSDPRRRLVKGNAAFATASKGSSQDEH
jgi:hypothetical protein